MVSTRSRLTFLFLAAITLSSHPGRAQRVETLRSEGTWTASTRMESAPTENGLDAGDYYIFEGRRMPLRRSEEVMGVRFRP